MHFVPAHVVPGWEDSVIDDEEPFVESPVDDEDQHAGDVGGLRKLPHDGVLSAAPAHYEHRPALAAEQQRGARRFSVEARVSRRRQEDRDRVGA